MQCGGPGLPARARLCRVSNSSPPASPPAPPPSPPAPPPSPPAPRPLPHRLRPLHRQLPSPFLAGSAPFTAGAPPASPPAPRPLPRRHPAPFTASSPYPRSVRCTCSESGTQRRPRLHGPRLHGPRTGQGLGRPQVFAAAPVVLVLRNEMTAFLQALNYLNFQTFAEGEGTGGHETRAATLDSSEGELPSVSEKHSDFSKQTHLGVCRN